MILSEFIRLWLSWIYQFSGMEQKLKAPESTSLGKLFCLPNTDFSFLVVWFLFLHPSLWNSAPRGIYNSFAVGDGFQKGKKHRRVLEMVQKSQEPL